MLLCIIIDYFLIFLKKKDKDLCAMHALLLFYKIRNKFIFYYYYSNIYILYVNLYIYIYIYNNNTCYILYIYTYMMMMKYGLLDTYTK